MSAPTAHARGVFATSVFVTTLATLLSHYRRHPGQLAMLLLGLWVASALWSGVQAINASARDSYARAEALFTSQLDRIERRDGEALTLDDYLTLRRAGDSGFYRGGFTPGEVGRYKVSYAPGSNATPGNASAPRSASSEISGWGGGVSAMVQVAGSQRELLHASMDYALLDELAQTTGGRVLAANELSQIESLIEATPTQVRRVVEAEAWDNWLTLVVLVGLYCLDVGVRRVLGLT